MSESKVEQTVEVEFSPGSLLKQAREQKCISVAEVAQQLRLTDACIHDIESDTYRPETPEAFYRGYIKNYAKHLQLNSDDFVQAFSDYIDKHSVYPKSGQSYTRSSVSYKPSKLPKILGNLILTLVILGVAYLGYYFLYEKAYWNKMVSGFSATSAESSELADGTVINSEDGEQILLLPIESDESLETLSSEELPADEDEPQDSEDDQ